MVFKLKVSTNELENIGRELQGKAFENEVKRLSKSPAFKYIAKTNPTNAFSKWEEVEKKANRIQKHCEKNLDNFLGKDGGVEYQNHYDYITQLLP